MDINAPNFVDSFDKDKSVVGIIGQGFVGGAMRAYFEHHKFPFVTYDKYKSDGGKLEDVVSKSDIIFVCVPTPMRHSGECYTGVVESVLDDITKIAKEVARPLGSFVVCIKSTVPAGFTNKQMKIRPDMRLVFSPEFLTEKNAVNDMMNANRIVVGGRMDDTKIVLQFFLTADKERVDSGDCVLVHCDAAVAEMAKLFTNGLLFTKVLFCNEVYQLCKKLDIRYDEVRIVGGMDPRIGAGHTAVPGHDGFLGAGGHCFPKDMHNLAFVAQELGTNEKMFSAVLQRNGELRDDKNWEKMNDRAVTNK